MTQSSRLCLFAAGGWRSLRPERPDFRKASKNLILALVKTGKGPEAVERARACYQMGLVLQRLGQLEASRSAFARAQTLNPSLVPPRDLR